MPEQVRILGVGNLLLRDEGAGIRVIEYLREEALLPQGVEAIDGGTGGMKLLPFIEGVKHLIVVDAVRRGGRPGALYRFILEEMPLRTVPKVSLHEVDLREVFSLFGLVRGGFPHTVIVGVEPGDVSPGVGLSPAVEASIPKAAEMVLNEVEACMSLP